MTIKQLIPSEITSALDIAKRAFDMFIAPDYSPEGINTFYDFIKPENIKARLDSGDFFMWGAFKNEKMTGVVAIRDNNHISLFSVDPNLHGKGIGRKLMETVFNHVRRMGLSFVTVNASPYAVPVYHKLGFGYTDVEQLTDGIKYTPMKADLSAYKDIKLGRYRHFKGNKYELLYIAKHSETLEEMVVYKALYGDGGVWVRPLSMWNETVESDGGQVKRFEYDGEVE